MSDRTSQRIFGAIFDELHESGSVSLEFLVGLASGFDFCIEDALTDEQIGRWRTKLVALGVEFYEDDEGEQ